MKNCELLVCNQYAKTYRLNVEGVNQEVKLQVYPDNNANLIIGDKILVGYESGIACYLFSELKDIEKIVSAFGGAMNLTTDQVNELLKNKFVKF